MRSEREAEFADRLALEFSLLTNCEIGRSDVLAALAAAGLKLVLDGEGDAFFALAETE
jgi:hypothetical protein